MDAKTLIALKGSIKKWEKIVKKTGVDTGIKNCSLCKIFRVNDPIAGSYCSSDCPVFIKEGVGFCRNTPYQDWYSHHEKGHESPKFPLRNECDVCQKWAQAELDSLKILLPGSGATSKE